MKSKKYLGGAREKDNEGKEKVRKKGEKRLKEWDTESVLLIILCKMKLNVSLSYIRPTYFMVDVSGSVHEYCLFPHVI